jgi:hypothetical protein
MTRLLNTLKLLVYSHQDTTLRIDAEYLQKKIYLTDYSLKNARQELFNELDEGAAFVNYLGHGGPDRFTNYGLLLSNDVNQLSTRGGSPIVTAMTCAVGEFIFTNFDTLSELLLLQPEGGATAVFSASGLFDNNRAKQLSKEFYKTILNEGSSLLGEAILKTFRNYSSIEEDPYQILIYNLLGDPALKIR